MAAVRAGIAGGGTSGTTDRTATFTPAVGDYAVVAVVVSANANTTPTCSDNNGGTYTRVRNGLFNGSTDMGSLFVRDQLFTNTTSTTVTVATGSNTSGEVAGALVSGMAKAGNAGVRQSARVVNQASGTAPAPVFASNALATNLVLGFVCNDTNPATMSAPINFTEQADLGQATPPVGLEIVSNNTSFTGTTVTWSSNSASNYCAFTVELDASDEGTSSATLGDVTGSAAGTIDDSGASSATLGATTGSATATVATAGASSATLGAVTGSAAAAVAVAGASSATLGATTGSAAGTVAVAGASSGTLGAVSGASAGTVGEGGTSGSALDPVTGSATGTVEVRGGSDVALDPTSGAAAGGVAIAGASSRTLDDVAGESAGDVVEPIVGAGEFLAPVPELLGSDLVTIVATGEVLAPGAVAGDPPPGEAGARVEGVGRVELPERGSSRWRRLRVRRAAWRRLRSSSPFHGRVFLDRAEALRHDARGGELPALLLHSLGEQVERFGMAPKEYRRTLRLGVEVLAPRSPARAGLARSGDRTADVEPAVLARLVQVVRQAFMREPTLGGEVDSVRHARTRKSYVDEGEVALGAALVEFDVVYYTEHREREDLLAGPLTTIATTQRLGEADPARDLLELQATLEEAARDGTEPIDAVLGRPMGPAEAITRLVRRRLVDRTNAGKRVRLGASEPVDVYRDGLGLPLLVLWDAAEDAEPFGEAPRVDLVTMRLSVLIYSPRRHARAGVARAGDRVAAAEADQLDVLEHQVEAALLSEPTLGGLVSDVEVAGVRFAHVVAETGLAVARVDFDVPYLQEYLEDALARAGEFLLAAVEWKLPKETPAPPRVIAADDIDVRGG
jgi:hypothetical protein